MTEVKAFYQKIAWEHPEVKLTDPLFVILTAHAEDQKFKRFLLKSGVDFVFEKPISSQKIHEIFENL